MAYYLRAYIFGLAKNHQIMYLFIRRVWNAATKCHDTYLLHLLLHTQGLDLQKYFMPCFLPYTEKI